MLLRDGMCGRFLAVSEMDGTEEAMKLDKGWGELISAGRLQL